MSYETTAEQRSSFIRYAETRIAKEVEDNERLEELAGTRDILPRPERYSTSGFTDEERLETIDAIQKLRDQGMTVSSACESHLVHPSTYHKWCRNLQPSNK